VTGGGLVPGGVLLLGGDPGIGKSTLLLQASASLGATRRTLVRHRRRVARADRASRAAARASSTRPIELLAEVQLEAIVARSARRSPRSWSSTRSRRSTPEALQSAPGSVAQVRECAAQLTRLAKQRGVVIIFVGHVTKEGAIAGPRVLEHIVDAVLYFEGDPHSSFRPRPGDQEPLRRRERARRVRDDRARAQGRVESVGPLPVPARAERSGVRGGRNARRLAPAARGGAGTGDPVQGGVPRRLAVGLDPQRCPCCSPSCTAMAGRNRRLRRLRQRGRGCAHPRAGRRLWPSCRPSILVEKQALPHKSIVFGEVGLAGEIRPVQRGVERIREAAKLGFTTMLVPSANKPKQGVDGVKVIAVDRVDEALANAARALAVRQYGRAGNRLGNAQPQSTRTGGKSACTQDAARPNITGGSATSRCRRCVPKAPSCA
jgi:DNA repair protein RadA/Sms